MLDTSTDVVTDDVMVSLLIRVKETFKSVNVYELRLNELLHIPPDSAAGVHTTVSSTVLRSFSTLILTVLD